MKSDKTQRLRELHLAIKEGLDALQNYTGNYSELRSLGYFNLSCLKQNIEALLESLGEKEVVSKSVSKSPSPKKAEESGVPEKKRRGRPAKAKSVQVAVVEEDEDEGGSEDSSEDEEQISLFS